MNFDQHALFQRKSYYSYYNIKPIGYYDAKNSDGVIEGIYQMELCNNYKIFCSYGGFNNGVIC